MQNFPSAMMSVRTAAVTGLPLFLLLLLQDKRADSSFTCYMCVFDTHRNESWNLPVCRDNPNHLPRYGFRECDDNQFCTFQLVYDRGENKITNYDRRCSATSLGNTCTPDASHVNCFVSCQEDYCNGMETIDELEQYLPNAATDCKSALKFGTLAVISTVLFIMT